MSHCCVGVLEIGNRGHRLLLVGHGDMDGWWPLDVALSSLRAVSTHWIVGPAVGPSPPAASPAFDRRDPASGRLAAASAPLDNSESAPPASVVGMRTMISRKTPKLKVVEGQNKTDTLDQV